MKFRTVFVACLPLVFLASAGCGGSSQKAEVPKVGDLTDADKAAFKAEAAKVEEEEKAQQAQDPTREGPNEKAAEDEERAAQRTKRKR